MSTILRYKYVTTRNPHICFGCGREFKSPVKMISAVSADGMMNMGLANCAKKR